MSRKATCLDNAPMESFFHTMKVELYHNKEYTTQEELVKAMISWISYYNNERIKVKLKGKTPGRIPTSCLKKYSINRVSNFMGSLQRSSAFYYRSSYRSVLADNS